MIYLCQLKWISPEAVSASPSVKNTIHTPRERASALRIIIKMTKCNFRLRAGVITRDARELTTKLGALKTIYTPQPKVLKRRRRTARLRLLHGRREVSEWVCLFDSHVVCNMTGWVHRTHSRWWAQQRPNKYDGWIMPRVCVYCACRSGGPSLDARRQLKCDSRVDTNVSHFCVNAAVAQSAKPVKCGALDSWRPSSLWWIRWQRIYFVQTNFL